MQDVIENTVGNMIPLQFENMLKNKDKDVKDIKEWETELPITRVVLLGTGPTASKFKSGFMQYTIGNQTTLRVFPDAVEGVIVTDAGVKYPKGILRPREGCDMFLASCVDPDLLRLLRKDWKHERTYMFHHPLFGGGNILDHVYRSLQPVGISTNIVQVGCSMNAGLLLMAKLMIDGKIPKTRIHLTGVDYYDPENPEDERFKLYAENLKIIVKGLSEDGFCITKEKGPGPLGEFIEEVE